jgi:hypothetical protein
MTISEQREYTETEIDGNQLHFLCHLTEKDLKYRNTKALTPHMMVAI